MTDKSYPAFPKIPRLFRDCVITEKLDGTNAQVCIAAVGEPYDPLLRPIAGDPCYAYLGETLYRINAGSRTRWLSLQADNFGFARWVHENRNELVKLGPGSHFGEWWGQGIQRGYGLTEKRFSLFNTKRWSDPAVRPACCHVVPVLYEGECFQTNAVKRCLEDLRFLGSSAVPGYFNPEGVVVYHTHANALFKVTLDNDDAPKGGN